MADGREKIDYIFKVVLVNNSMVGKSQIFARFSMALIPVNLIDPSPTAAAVSPEEETAAAKSLILIFLYFHKALLSELDRLHRAVVAIATDRDGDVCSFTYRCSFFFSIYKNHCIAEDVQDQGAKREQLTISRRCGQSST